MPQSAPDPPWKRPRQTPRPPEAPPPPEPPEPVPPPPEGVSLEVRALIPSEVASRVIGERGSIIGSIAKATGTYMNISRDSWNGTENQVLTVRSKGSYSKVPDAAAEILQLACSELGTDPHAMQATLLLPFWLAPLFVGRGGSRVAELQEASRCYVSLRRPAWGSEDEEMHIKGPSSGFTRVLEAVCDVQIEAAGPDWQAPVSREELQRKLPPPPLPPEMPEKVPRVVEPRPRREPTPPRVVEPRPRRESSPPRVVEPRPWRESPPPRVEPRPRRESSPPRVVEPRPRRDSSPPRVVPPRKLPHPPREPPPRAPREREPLPREWEREPLPREREPLPRAPPRELPPAPAPPPMLPRPPPMPPRDLPPAPPPVHEPVDDPEADILERECFVKMQLPTNLAIGALIGKGGSFMKKMKLETGAQKLHIEDAADGVWLEIQGSLGEVQAAQTAMMRKVVEVSLAQGLI